MSNLREELLARVRQLENRVMMIPRYVERPEAFLGKKDYSMEDIPKLKAQIEETKAAIRGIDEWKKTLKDKR